MTKPPPPVLPPATDTADTDSAPSAWTDQLLADAKAFTELYKVRSLGGLDDQGNLVMVGLVGGFAPVPMLVPTQAFELQLERPAREPVPEPTLQEVAARILEVGLNEDPDAGPPVWAQTDRGSVYVTADLRDGAMAQFTVGPRDEAPEDWESTEDEPDFRGPMFMAAERIAELLCEPLTCLGLANGQPPSLDGLPEARPLAIAARVLILSAPSDPQPREDLCAMADPVRIPASDLRSELDRADANAHQAYLAWSAAPPKPAGEAMTEDAWFAHCEHMARDFLARHDVFASIHEKLRALGGNLKDAVELPAEHYQLLRRTRRVDLPEPAAPSAPADTFQAISTLQRPPGLDDGERVGVGGGDRDAVTGQLREYVDGRED